MADIKLGGRYRSLVIQNTTRLWMTRAVSAPSFDIVKISLVTPK